MSGNIKKNKQKIINKPLRREHFKRKKQNKSDKKISKVFTYELPSRKTVEVSHCSLAFLIVLAFASIIVLIVDVYLFALPVLTTNNFRNTVCRVHDYKFIGFESCKCGGLTNASPYCTSNFPCVHITVDYNIHTKTASNSTQRSIVYQDEAVLQAETYNCSFSVCKESRKLNTIELESFKSQFGSFGSIYDCMYNRDDTKQVIISRRYGLTALVLSLALPALVFFVSIFLFFIVCKTTVNEQVKQLRIKSNRSYIKPGVKLINGTRTKAVSTNKQVVLPGSLVQNVNEVSRIATSTKKSKKKSTQEPYENRTQIEVIRTNSL